ncbi:DUF4271 domain-containing protein [Spirosoma sp. KUDC1026]|uniref:DUF4271 domain-containing protein n=1 Tax=Spirosoma sp. KUDC1026 TaxID=2745947 RepID=UPI001E3D99A3|nr:DUF4271 domain-containing protein [Spirosoma sp. KUDC1026]
MQRVVRSSVPLFRSFILSLFLFVFSASAQQERKTNGVGPEGRYYPVHNFQDDFLVYDEGAQAYVPYIAEQHAAETALSTYVDLESNRHYNLLVSTKQDGYLFINAALKRKLIGGQWQVLSIDSLYQVYRSANRRKGLGVRPEIFLTLYGAAGIKDKQLFVAYSKSASTQKLVVLRDDNLSVRPRPGTTYESFLSAGLLFLLATHAFLYAFSRRAFQRFYSLRDLLSLRAQEESFLINRPLSGTNILFTLNLGFVIAYLALFVQHQGIDLVSSQLVLPGEPRFWWLSSEFLLLGVGAFLVIMSKYVALEVVGGLYKLQDTVAIHFFKIQQSSLLFFTLLTLLLAVIAYNTSAASWSQNVLLFPLIGFYLLRLALLYLVIRTVEPIKNLYLFSYLCLVELIPLIIGLRYVL